MTIYRHLQDSDFSPEQCQAMGRAFEETLMALGLNRNDPLAELVAKKIIKIAQQGELNSVRIREQALTAFASQ